MLTCKEVCEQATEHLEQSSSAWQRLSFRFHLLICHNCRRFMRQFRLTMSAANRLYTPSESSDTEIENLLRKMKQI